MPPPAHSNSGVDARQKSSDNEKAVNTHRLSLGFAWTPKDRAVGPWRQRSTSSRDQKFVDQSSAQEKRTIRVGSQGAAVAVLICGELFNPQLEGLCLREIAFRQCLVDHGDAGSGTIIRRAEIAPGCDRHPQQLKIARVTDRSGTAIRSLAFSGAGCPSISTLPGRLLPVSDVPHGPIGDGIADGSRIAR